MSNVSKSLPVLATLLPLLLLACPPLGPLPGGALSGEVVSGPTTDWSFSDDADSIQVETNPEKPYSVTTWGIGLGEYFYVASGGGEKSRWAQNLIEDPRVRIRIHGKLYELNAVKTDDEDEKAEVVKRLMEKYDYERDSEQESRAVLFRMEPR